MEALRALYVVIELRDKLSSQLSEINKVVDQTKSKLSSLTEFVEKHKAAIAGLGAVLSAVGYGDSEYSVAPLRILSELS